MKILMLICILFIKLQNYILINTYACTFQSIGSKQLGPYGGGSYTSSLGQTVKLIEARLNDLKEGLNEEKVVLGKVVCSVMNEDTVPL